MVCDCRETQETLNTEGAQRLSNLTSLIQNQAGSFSKHTQQKNVLA